jgi:single-stranded-DNA-specific exonuclease
MNSPSTAESMIERLNARATACADRLREASSVLITSHIDADGLTSAAIAATALERAGIKTETTFENQLDEDALKRIAARDEETVLFTDFGSGQLDQIVEYEQADDFTPIIADHHQPTEADTEFHLNPLLEGIDGASELSGAGTAYILARALETEDGDDQHTDNRDLATLAVVGAVGDRQLRDGELIGANRQIVAEGVEVGVLDERTDIAFYGKQTRPLPKLLEYADDVRIPGFTGDEAGAITFLSSLDSNTDTDLDLRDGTTWQRWVDLPRVQQQQLMSAIVQHAIKRGVSHEAIDNLIGTSYLLSEESEGTELRDASEFSTLLNSTARYDRAKIGFAVCRSDRDIALHHARELRSNHKRRLSEGLELVKREGVTREEYVQWFDAGKRIRDTIVGIVAGMALGSEGISIERPIIAFATKNNAESAAEADEKPERKVSARGTNQLVQQGLNLAVVMNKAAEAVDGGGGGHDVAAGATIPAGRETSFVEHANRIVGEQLE